MISVVIPLYNKASLIEETIQSVLKQTFTDFELIIINDGSTDDSAAVVDRIQDPRIHLINIKNSGVSVARNTGIETATRPWIALLDGDDWWAPTFLEEMVDAIKAFPQNVLFASGRCLVFTLEEERYAHAMLPRDGETAVINYFRVISEHLPLINSSNVVIKKSHFESAGFFRPGQKQHEDHDLWMRLAIKQGVVFVNKNLSFYRKNETGSASQNSYKAPDFKTFLETMISVKNKLTEEELNYFNTYANRFCILTYLKHYGTYSKQEKQMIKRLLLQLLHGKSKLLFALSRMLPFDLYPLLKRIKG